MIQCIIRYWRSVSGQLGGCGSRAAPGATEPRWAIVWVRPNRRHLLNLGRAVPSPGRPFFNGRTSPRRLRRWQVREPPAGIFAAQRSGPFCRAPCGARASAVGVFRAQGRKGPIGRGSRDVRSKKSSVMTQSMTFFRALTAVEDWCKSKREGYF